MSADYDQVDVRLLTPLLKKIISVIGIAAAMKLLKARGGTRVRVPVSDAAWPLVARVIGDESGRNLARVFQGQEFVLLPKADKVLAMVRNAEICRRNAQGDSQLDLAIEFDLTTRAIQLIVAAKGLPSWHRDSPESPQADLFGAGAVGAASPDPVKDPFKNSPETRRPSAGISGAPARSRASQAP